MRRAMFDCCKWQTHVEDRPVLCSFPLLLERSTWDWLARQAEDLAHEAVDAEAELRHRPDLHADLGLPWALRRHLRRGMANATPRVIRFDFHWTTDGWRISEANSDVCGGYIEASGVTPLVAACYPNCRPAGDPAGGARRGDRAAHRHGRHRRPDAPDGPRR